MAFDFFNKFKNCLCSLFNHNSHNVIQDNLDENNLTQDNLDNGDELMAGKKPIVLTEEQCQHIKKEWPVAGESICTIKSENNNGVSYEILYKDLTDKRKAIKKEYDENESFKQIPTECTDYVNEIEKEQKQPSTKKKKQSSNKNNSSKNKSSTEKSSAITSVSDETKKPEPEIIQINSSESKIDEKLDVETIIEPEKFEPVTPELTSQEQKSTISEPWIDDQETLTTWNWRRLFDAVVGSSHLKANPPIPCQDSALAVLVPRPAIFVADGAGSAKLSHYGSKAVVNNLETFIMGIEDINREYLDQEKEENVEEDKKYVYRFIKYVIATLKKLSEERKEPFNLFRCTLLITIIGKNRLFWLKVGDGFIVIEKEEKLELVGPLGKGDFANQTTFITENLADKDIHYGFIPVQNITGITAFTDGAGEKLVSNDGLQIAGTLAKFFQGMRTKDFTQDKLNEFLSNKDIWLKTTGDDKGIAILSLLK